MRKYEPFDTEAAMVSYLATRGYRRDDDSGRWFRASWEALVTRLKNGKFRVEFL